MSDIDEDATALVAEADGSIGLLLPDRDDDEEMSENQMIFAALLIRLNDPLFRQEQLDFMRDSHMEAVYE